MFEIDKGIHAPRERHHVLHGPIGLKHLTQQGPGQAGMEVAQPQVPARGTA
jgi:hypothetical protein